MFKATKEICTAFDQNEFKYSTKETDESSSVVFSWRVTNGTNYNIRFISRDDDSDVSIRVFSLLHIQDDKISSVIVALNKINSDYRYINFYLDDDGDVDVKYDLPISTNNVGEVCVELTTRFITIIDKAYPVLMKALWS